MITGDQWNNRIKYIRECRGDRNIYELPFEIGSFSLLSSRTVGKIHGCEKQWSNLNMEVIFHNRLAAFDFCQQAEEPKVSTMSYYKTSLKKKRADWLKRFCFDSYDGTVVAKLVISKMFWEGERDGHRIIVLEPQVKMCLIDESFFPEYYIIGPFEVKLLDYYEYYERLKDRAEDYFRTRTKWVRELRKEEQWKIICG